MQPNGCILVPAAQIPSKRHYHGIRRRTPASRADHFFSKRPCSKVDDPVMASQNSAPSRPATAENLGEDRYESGLPRSITPTSLQQYHRADRESPNPGDFHATLLQVDGR